MAGRMAGVDPGVQALAAGALLAGYGVPSVANTIDWFTGDTKAWNSGEIPLNTLIALLPLATMGAGGAAAAALSPAARLHLDGSVIKAAAQSGVELPAGNKRAYAKRWLDMASRLQEADANLGRNEAIRRVGVRGARAMHAGAFLGALAGGIPAVMMMQDQPSREAGS